MAKSTMKVRKKGLDDETLMGAAYSYIEDCIEKKKEVVTNKGIMDIKERHLPTISYFLNIWLPMYSPYKETYHRCYFYDIKSNENHPLYNTIKSIDELFRSLATDIVANEGKGIFYAKNYLGMRDTPKEEEKQVQEIIFKFGTSE